MLRALFYIALLSVVFTACSSARQTAKGPEESTSFLATGDLPEKPVFVSEADTDYFDSAYMKSTASYIPASSKGSSMVESGGINWQPSFSIGLSFGYMSGYPGYSIGLGYGYPFGYSGMNPNYFMYPYGDPFYTSSWYYRMRFNMGFGYPYYFGYPYFGYPYYPYWAYYDYWGPFYWDSSYFLGNCWHTNYYGYAGSGTSNTSNNNGGGSSGGNDDNSGNDGKDSNLKPINLPASPVADRNAGNKGDGNNDGSSDDDSFGELPKYRKYEGSDQSAMNNTTTRSASYSGPEISSGEGSNGNTGGQPDDGKPVRRYSRAASATNATGRTKVNTYNYTTGRKTYTNRNGSEYQTRSYQYSTNSYNGSRWNYTGTSAGRTRSYPSGYSRSTTTRPSGTPSYSGGRSGSRPASSGRPAGGTRPVARPAGGATRSAGMK